MGISVQLDRIGIGQVDQLESLLERDPFVSIFLRSHLEKDGLDTEGVTFWGSYRADTLLAAAVVCELGFLSYASLSGNDEEALAVLGRHLSAKPPSVVLGRRDFVEAVASELDAGTIRRFDEFVLHEDDPKRFRARNAEWARKSDRADLEKLVDFYAKSREYTYRDKNRAARVVRYLLERGSCFVVERDGQIVSALLSTAETKDAAYLDWGWTLPSHRRRGYQTAALSAFAAWLQEQNRRVLGTIATKNFQEQRIKDRLAGRRTAEWAVLRLQARASASGRAVARMRHLLRRWRRA